MKSFVVLLSCLFAVAYVDRSVLSHLIILISQEFSLTPEKEGLLLGVFSVGYILGMLPGGWLADKFGPRRTILGAMVGWILFSYMCCISNSYITLLIARLGLGISESPLFPAAIKWITRVTPKERQTSLIAIIESGSYVGFGVAGPIAVGLSSRVGWRGVFLATALLAIPGIFALFVRKLAFPKELSCLYPTAISKIPKEDYQRVAFLGCGFFCYNACKAFYLTWMPTFLIRYYEFTAKGVAQLTFIMPICAILANVAFGYFVDYWSRKTRRSLGPKMVALVVGFSVSTTVCGIPFCSNKWEVMSVVVLAYSGLIAVSGIIWSLPAALARSQDHIGRLGAVQNVIANIGSFVAPIYFGKLFAIGAENIALWSVGIVGLVGIAIYYLGLMVYSSANDKNAVCRQPY